SDLQVKAVGPEVDGGERVVARHCTINVTRSFVAGIFQLLPARSAAGQKIKLQPPLQDHESPAVNKRIALPAQFLNRELEILEFNRRVLAQAADEAVPLLERLRFITIVSSNLDEFFEIRVAGLKEQIKLGLPEPGPDGRGPAEVFAAVSSGAHSLVADQ